MDTEIEFWAARESEEAVDIRGFYRISDGEELRLKPALVFCCVACQKQKCKHEPGVVFLNRMGVIVFRSGCARGGFGLDRGCDTGCG